MIVEQPRSELAVPFMDLRAIHAPLEGEIFSRLSGLVDRSEFVTGPTVAEFEEAFAAYSGTGYCVGVGSGLDALRLSLQALGLGAGDEVIVPANTFVATFEAVAQVGAIPVPADVSLTDYNLEPSAVEAAVGSRTRVILPVHLYGQMADMNALTEIAHRYSLDILEDACQAHGASRAGRRPGDQFPAAFSFYPGKNLGAFGDAGAVATNNERLAGHVRMLREHGQREKYLHEEVGWTSRLDAVQAAVLAVKLPHLAAWNDDRRRIAARYDEVLDGVGDLALPPRAAESNPVWHLYVVRTADPERFAASLRDDGVQTGRHYPQPPHLSGAFRHLGRRSGEFPVTEQLAEHSVSLPVFPGMTDAQIHAVGASVRDYFEHA